jgi:His-Xaa-Ser system protein HxsD
LASFPLSVGEKDVSLEISDSVYPIAAVHGTAVLYVDKAYVRIDRAAPGRTRITLRPKAGAASVAELSELGGEVLNELLHQALRVEVGARTDKLRELVIGKGAMAAEAAPGGPGMVDAGVAFSDDPLGIARPWEETYLGEQPGGTKEAGK